MTMSEEIYLVEILENLYIDASIEYLKRCELEWETLPFNPTEFDKILSGKVLESFTQLINEKIKSTNQNKSAIFFTLSLIQFSSYTPENRLEAFKIKYHNAYIHPKIVEFNSNASFLYSIPVLFAFYSQYFNQYRDIFLKAFDSFKCYVLGITLHSNLVQDHNSDFENCKSFNAFVNTLASVLVHDRTPIQYKKDLSHAYNNFKSEIMQNIILLDVDKRLPYLRKIQNYLLGSSAYKSPSKEFLDYLQTRFNFSVDDELVIYDNNNTVTRLLSYIPMQINNKFSPDYNEKYYEIQSAYLLHSYNLYVNKAKDFVDAQIIEYSPQLMSQSLPPVPISKLKTSLSVPQLALLFKMLKELKPSIFEIESEAELLRFISNSFETKKSNEDGISVQKLRQLFNKPDDKAANFWEKHFYTFIAEVKKYK